MSNEIHRTIRLLGVMAVLGAVLVGSVVRAGRIIQDFEGETLGSGTPPAGWSFITVDASPYYLTTNGASGVGLGGSVYANHDSNGSGIPGGYIVANELAGAAPFDLTAPITGSFNFYITEAGGYSSALFFFGDVEDGVAENQPGEYIGIRLMKNSFANRSGIVNGAGGSLKHLNDGTSLDSSTWYRLDFTWTPTSGLTGDFSFTISGADNWTRGYNGFTFDSNRAFFGFGTGGYYSNWHTPIFDNINIEGKPLKMAGMVLIFR